MNKIVRFFVPLGLAAVMSFSIVSLTACNDGKQPEATNPNPPIGAPENPTPGNPTPADPTPENPPASSWNTEAYDIFVANMGLKQNYTYSITEGGNRSIYQIDGDTVLIDEYQTYLYIENNQYYRLEFNNGDGKYHKTLAEAYYVEDYIFSKMQLASITDYSAETKKYTVDLGGETFEMTLSDVSVEFANSEKTIVVENLGTTSVVFPRDKFIINDVKEPVTPENPPVEPDDPIVTEDKIYTVNAQGVRTYNSGLLAETFKTVMNAEVEDGKTLYNKYTYDMGVSVDDVLFVSTEGDNIEIGVVAQLGSNKVVEVVKMQKASVEGIGDDKQAWYDAIKTMGLAFELKSDLVAINYDVSMEQAHQEELKQVMAKALDKVAVDGVQPNGINVKGEPQLRFANSEVLKVFEGPDDSDGSFGYGLGDNIRCKSLIGIVKDGNGQVVFISMNVATTKYKTFENSILNGDINDNFVIYKMDRSLDVNNDLYKSEEKTNNASRVAQSLTTALPQGRGKGE